MIDFFLRLYNKCFYKIFSINPNTTKDMYNSDDEANNLDINSHSAPSKPIENDMYFNFSCFYLLTLYFRFTQE